jgi:hypothetical protein
MYDYYLERSRFNSREEIAVGIPGVQSIIDKRYTSDNSASRRNT